MLESLIRSLPEIEISVRNDILNKYPNVKILFTKENDGITYVDIITSGNKFEKDIEDEIDSIIDLYRNDLSSNGKCYLTRIID